MSEAHKAQQYLAASSSGDNPSEPPSAAPPPPSRSQPMSLSSSALPPETMGRSRSGGASADPSLRIPVAHQRTYNELAALRDDFDSSDLR